MPLQMRQRPELAATCLAAMLLAAIIVGGCSKGTSLSERMRRKTPAELVAMAFDPDDADRRRQGVTELSSKSWGLQEPYLNGYATMLHADDDALVRSAAARALGKAGEVKYLSDVVAALEDSSPAVRWDAAVALDSLIGHEAITPLCKHAVDDEALDVRASCARALRHYSDLPVVAALKQCLRDRDFSVRYQAKASLTTIMGVELGYEPDAWPDDPQEAPAPEQRRRWWDRFKMRGREEPNTQAAPDAEAQD